MLVLITILSFYIVAILVLIYGFGKIKKYKNIDIKPKTSFTIIVPFRNEVENLPILLKSLENINYPLDLFEVLLVDDDSDLRFKIADLRYKTVVTNNIRTSNSPKKDAITTAMQMVKTEWIITTDADCVVPKNWLLTLDNYIQTNEVSMIAGAVNYSGNNSFLHHFQQLDLASLQGATMGSFGIGKGFMCNGANFAYTKSLFNTLNGFEGNNKVASGDDVFLLQKAISQFPEHVHYLKSEDCVVSTKALNDWKSLFYQRVRWASKTPSYQSDFGKILGIIVFAGNLSLWFVVYGLLLGVGNFYVLSFLLLSKLSIDFVLIHKTNLFLKSKTTSYFRAALLYPFFSIAVACYSLFGKYEWKGRRF